ncbi:MAG: nucleoside recognition protein, partial [Opitutia bacterium Tous-C10FEB]
MLNYLWLALVTLAVLIGGATGRLREVTEGAFQMADMAVMKIALPLAGIMALWLGVMRLAEQSGLVQKLAAALRPLMSRLFPDVPADHPAMGSMVMNMAANMLGLANAATPLGLRAMRDLETLNRTPGTATNAMCTFLAINTSSIQLLPTTAIAILASQHAQDPTAIVGTAFLATICSTVAGVVAVKAMQNWPMFRVQPGAAAAVSPSVTLDPIPLRLPPAPAPLPAWGRAALILFIALFAGLFFWQVIAPAAYQASTAHLHRAIFPSTVVAPAAEAAAPLPLRAIGMLSLLAVPFLLGFFPLYAALRGVKVYEEFVEGAKEGFGVALR